MLGKEKEQRMDRENKEQPDGRLEPKTRDK